MCGGNAYPSLQMMKRYKGQIQGFETNLTIGEVIEQLNSKEQPEVFNGLRNLTALLSHGVAVEGALPHVIKLVVYPDLQVRRVVYTFLAHFSEECPAQALMAVNILYRALADKNSLVRGLAMRALTSIRVREIAEVAKLSMEQHKGDEAPFVRRIIAIGVGKMAGFCPEFISDLMDLLTALLDDHVAQVVGAAIQTYNIMCPENYELIHPHFHKICGMMNEFDEFYQVDALYLLARYCRSYFADCRNLPDDEISPDLAEAFKAAALLLRIHYPSVVLEAASFLYHCSPSFNRQYEIQGVCYSASHAVAVSLVRQASNYLNMNPLALFTAIRQISETHSILFVAFYKDFYINSFDSNAVKFQKICILKNLVRSVPDTEQDNVFSELKMYLQYSLSSEYEEQQELSAYVLQAIGNILQRKACAMLTKLDEFNDEYFSVLMGPIQRAVRQGADYLFVNDIIFYQSVVEACKVLAVIYSEAKVHNMFVENAPGDILVVLQQMYTDIEQDASQDRRYVLPRALWPSSLGFPQDFDPIEFKDGAYTGRVNSRSLVQATKASIFIQQQMRQISRVYPVMSHASQSPRCVDARATLVYMIVELKEVFAPFCAEFLRRALRTLTDEPAPLRRALCCLTQVVAHDIAFFRAAPVYFMQRRMLTDVKTVQAGGYLANAASYALVVSESGESVPDVKALTVEQVAEEQGNTGYCIEQMASYAMTVCQLDISLDVRDFATVMQFAGQDALPSAGTPPLAPQVMGALSNIIGAIDDTTRQLPLWAPVNSPDSVRTRSSTAKSSYQMSAYLELQSPGMQMQPKASTGIQIRSNQNVNDFLGGQRAPAPKEENSDSYYYYSDDEQPESAAYRPTVPAAKPQVVQTNPVVAKPIIRVAPVPVAQTVKPTYQKAVVAPVKPAVVQSVSPAVVQSVKPAAVQGVKPGAPVSAYPLIKQEAAEPPKAAENDEDDLLNMLFQ